jgi:hypothetical protein
MRWLPLVAKTRYRLRPSDLRQKRPSIYKGNLVEQKGFDPAKPQETLAFSTGMFP